MSFITARKRSLGQSNIFRSVCQEFCSWGRWRVVFQHALQVVSQHALQVSREGVFRPTARGEVEGSGQRGSPGPYPGGLQAHTQGGLHAHTGGGGGVHIPACTEADTPPWTATATGGTHPTGMHSCYSGHLVYPFHSLK